MCERREPAWGPPTHRAFLPLGSCMSRLFVPLLLLSFGALHCTTPRAVGPAPAVAPSGKPGPGAAGAPVAAELTELRIVIDQRGDTVQQVREVYRVLAAEPPPAWAQAYAFWRPWTDEPPVLEATVVRPDGTTARLDPATATDQPEPRSDGLLTDGRLRVAPLPGLTPGSVVDRRSTTRVRAQLIDAVDLGLSLGGRVFEKRRRVIIDAPAGLPLTWKVLNAQVTPSRSEAGGRVVLTFERSDVEPDSEGVPLAPLGAAGPAVLRVSTVKSWQAAAAAWAALAEPQLEPQAVASLAAELTRGLEGRDAKAKAVAVWVRRNVRYTGLELGAAAWVPTRTSEVLARKYGDCKDLSLLTVALLRGAGLEAEVALVRASGQLDVDESTPGLSLFDHAIVRLGGQPEVWLDPTAPLLAFGELTRQLPGRRALIARRDTRGLVPVVSVGASRLDAQVELALQESGRARFRRTRDSEGVVFAENRAIAANNPEVYRQTLEKFARDTHASARPVTVEQTDPLAAAPFHEVLEIADSNMGVTGGDWAVATASSDFLFVPLGPLLELKRANLLDKRKEPIALGVRAAGTVVNVLRPPPGFHLDELPANVQERLGPVALAVAWERAEDEAIRATLQLSVEPGELSADDARRLVDEVLPRLVMRVKFENVVLSAITKERYHTAVTLAEALLAKSGSAVSRALLAYALAEATLQPAAEEEARAALNEAPENALVRNRAAFVLLHNAHGVEFGKGYRRQEALDLVGQTLKLYPDDEWSRRLHVLLGLRDEAGRRLPQADPALVKEIREYKEKTRSAELDDELLALDVQRQAWKEVVADAPKLKQTTARDGAWLAAELSLDGVDAALQHAGRDERMSGEALGVATMHLMSTRQYPVLQKLFDALGKKGGRDAANNPSVRMVYKLKPCAAAQDDVRAPFVRMLQAVFAPEKDRHLERVFTAVPTAEEQRGIIAWGRSLLGTLPVRDGSDLSGFTCDLFGSLVLAETRPLEGLGEVVTLTSEVPGLFEPLSYLARKTKDGYRLVQDGEHDAAASGLGWLGKGNVEKANDFFRAVVRLRRDAPRRLKSEGREWADLAPFWAAWVAVQADASRAAGVGFLEARVGKGALTELQVDLLAGALERAWKDAPDKRVALARRLRAQKTPEAVQVGTQLELRALRGKGAFAEAKKVLEAALKQAPADDELLGAKEHLAADLGDFGTARRLAAEMAQKRGGKEAGPFLNNAAWYSIFGKPDDEAVRQAEAAVQLEGDASHYNTLAAVYVGLERWDDAARAFKRQQRGESLDDEDSLHPSYWWVRGRLAEGFNRPALAAAAYRKMKREKNGSADDTYLLAEKRLRVMGK